jgi:hypothetical protein
VLYLEEARGQLAWSLNNSSSSRTSIGRARDRHHHGPRSSAADVISPSPLLRLEDDGDDDHPRRTRRLFEPLPSSPSREARHYAGVRGFLAAERTRNGNGPAP